MNDLLSANENVIAIYYRVLYYVNRPFQGYRSHIAGGAKTLGRARGHAWRPYKLLINAQKLPLYILAISFKNISQTRPF